MIVQTGLLILTNKIMSRIQLTDNVITMITKMSEGNPGSMNVLMEMLKPESKEIDPDNFMGGIGKVLSLDTLEIYGTDIYILHNDICDGNMVKTFAVLRAHQLGFLNGPLLKDACHRQDRSGKQMIDVDGLYNKVKEALPNFKQLEAVKE